MARLNIFFKKIKLYQLLVIVSKKLHLPQMNNKLYSYFIVCLNLWYSKSFKIVLFNINGITLLSM
jgi:hypothetical protein